MMKRATVWLKLGVIYLASMFIGILVCALIGAEVVELIYRCSMGFSLSEPLGRDLGLGVLEVFAFIPECVIGFVVGVALATGIVDRLPTGNADTANPPTA